MIILHFGQDHCESMALQANYHDARLGPDLSEVEQVKEQVKDTTDQPDN
jgi:hypothetical protein